MLQHKEITSNWIIYWKIDAKVHFIKVSSYFLSLGVSFYLVIVRKNVVDKNDDKKLLVNKFNTALNTICKHDHSNT